MFKLKTPKFVFSYTSNKKSTTALSVRRRVGVTDIVFANKEKTPATCKCLAPNLSSYLFVGKRNNTCVRGESTISLVVEETC